MLKIGIIGNGFVGNATTNFQNKDIVVIVYDKDYKKCVPLKTTMDEILETELVFICVPTPMNEKGECYLEIVESVVAELHQKEYKGFIIIRSTVPVGTSDRLNCFFCPEFLTEKNYKNDFIHNKSWVFGIPQSESSVRKDNFEFLIHYLLSTAKQNNSIKYDDAYFLPNKEAEMVKLMKNCFLATKVSFCNEIYEFCQKKNINYKKICDVVTLDERIGKSHTQVPGHDGNFGFGGTCFPKDISNLQHEMKKIRSNSLVIDAVIERNNSVDRVEKDWQQDEGRAFVKK